MRRRFFSRCCPAPWSSDAASDRAPLSTATARAVLLVSEPKCARQSSRSRLSRWTEAVAQTPREAAGSVLRRGSEIGHRIRHARCVRSDVVTPNRSGGRFSDRTAALPRRVFATASVQGGSPRHRLSAHVSIRKREPWGGRRVLPSAARRAGVTVPLERVVATIPCEGGLRSGASEERARQGSAGVMPMRRRARWPRRRLSVPSPLRSSRRARRRPARPASGRRACR